MPACVPERRKAMMLFVQRRATKLTRGLEGSSQEEQLEILHMLRYSLDDGEEM